MSHKKPANRRDFLKMTATGAPVAAVVVLTSDGAEAAPARKSDRGDACMQDTAHVRRYYELARF
ncbi:MAG: twin-arginine translocation signal domain-containing protein [Geminicoccaceae bacterium]